MKRHRSCRKSGPAGIRTTEWLAVSTSFKQHRPDWIVLAVFVTLPPCVLDDASALLMMALCSYQPLPTLTDWVMATFWMSLLSFTQTAASLLQGALI